MQAWSSTMARTKTMWSSHYGVKRDLPVAGAIHSNSSRGVVFRVYRLTYVVLLKLAGITILQRLRNRESKKRQLFYARKHGQHTEYNIQQYMYKKKVSDGDILGGPEDTVQRHKLGSTEIRYNNSQKVLMCNGNT